MLQFYINGNLCCEGGVFFHSQGAGSSEGVVLGYLGSRAPRLRWRGAYMIPVILTITTTVTIALTISVTTTAADAVTVTITVTVITYW